MGIELNNDQVYACYDLENWWHRGTKQLFEISGGAGCGGCLHLSKSGSLSETVHRRGFPGAE